MYPTLDIGYQSEVDFGALTFIQPLHTQNQIGRKLLSTADSYSPDTTDGGSMYFETINVTDVNGRFASYAFIRTYSRDGLMSLLAGENGRVLLASNSLMTLMAATYYGQLVDGILGSGTHAIPPLRTSPMPSLMGAQGER